MFLTFDSNFTDDDKLVITGITEEYNHNSNLLIPTKETVSAYVNFSRQVIAEQLKSKITKSEVSVKNFELAREDIQTNYDHKYLDVLALAHENIIRYFNLMPQQVLIIEEYGVDTFGSVTREYYEDYIKNKNSTFFRLKSKIDDCYDNLYSSESLEEVMQIVYKINAILAI